MDRVTGNTDLLKRFLLGVTGDDLQESFFEGIHKLPGGHNLEYDLERNSVSIWRYYQVAFDADLYRSDFQEMQTKFFNLLQDSIRIRMRSDVPVGTCLSGGLDSSSIAALASQLYSAQSDQKFKAITACSTEPQNDESKFASSVVQHHALDWICVKPDYEGFSGFIDAVVRTQEEPFGSASIVMQYFVMRTAAEHGVRVLLDGQGGDEVLMGYERYFIPYFRGLIHGGAVSKAFQEVRNMTHNNSVMSLSQFLKYAVYFSSATIREQRIKRRTHFLREMPDNIAEVRKYAKAAQTVFALQKYEIETSNLPPLLRFEDKNAMHFSVETRLPLLDHRIVELGCSIPVHHKINKGWTKYILREAIKDHLPDDIVWRKNKLGFAAPQKTWVKAHRREMLETITKSELLRTLVDMDALVSSDFDIDEASFWRLFIVARWENVFSVGALL
jgi:asparagine synthase (glutamine-hydrolysing)